MWQTTASFAGMLKGVRPYLFLLDIVKRHERSELAVALEFLKLRLHEFVNSLDILV